MNWNGVAAVTEDASRCGFVAVMGRPNVGKSTLVNALLGVKLSITSRRAQTTRDRILGIKTRSDGQIVLLDTPGLHRSEGRALNRYMNRAAAAALDGADVAVMVVEALKWLPDDDAVLARVLAAKTALLLAVNKVDLVSDKSRLLPYLSDVAHRAPFLAVVPISARRQRDADRLADLILARLPVGDPIFPQDLYTDRSERFLCAEIVREKLIRLLGQEVPHRLAVEVETFQQRANDARLSMRIWVESRGQKVIVIGRGGARLKRVGTEARRDIERLLGVHVHLELWVKVRSGWSDDERFLGELGYRD
jgi:GTP-binding protein Era